MSEKQKEHWHLRKEITIGNLFMTIAMIVTFITYAATLENRIALNGNNIQNLKERVAYIDDRNEQQFSEIKKALVRIDTKIDHINNRP